MDSELKAHLEGMEDRLGVKLGAQLADVGGQVQQRIASVESTLREQVSALTHEIQAVESRLREHVEAVETRLLGEFWKWARTADARYRQNQGLINGIDERLMILEQRVNELDRRDPKH